MAPWKKIAILKYSSSKEESNVLGRSGNMNVWESNSAKSTAVTSRLRLLIHAGKTKSHKTLTACFLVTLLVASSFSTLVSVNAAPTYYVTINTNYNNTPNGIFVPIIIDGAPTSYKTPHTFITSGTHNFTVPYSDSSGYPFSTWDANTPTDPSYTTITVSSGGSYWAFYSDHVPRSSTGPTDYVFPAEMRYYVTPTDPSVLAVAAGKSWSDIINWVSSHVTYNASLKIWQFPNETLSVGSGECREFSTLAVSMLLARGYNAYVVTGNATDQTGASIGHAWVVLQLNGSFYHFEPQKSWAKQPSPQNFSTYLPEYFIDNVELYPAGASQDPPPAETYDVTINTNFNGVPNNIHVAIAEDGTPTGFTTPYSFVGLSGSHNFTVPYIDDADHPFMSWGSSFPGDKIYPTINTVSGGSFAAFYDSTIDLSDLYPAEKIYLVTPSDPAVTAAAAGKSWSEILDYVSNLPYASTMAPQFPNQTIINGVRFYVDFASLAASLLRAQGYTTYLVGGASTSTDSWIVLNLNGTFIHFDPRYPSTKQQSNDFSSYQANYYVDEKGIYPAGVSLDPSAISIDPIQTPQTTPTLTASPQSSQLPTSTPNPIPTKTPMPTATQSPSVPEFPLNFASIALVCAVFTLTIYLTKKSPPNKKK